MLVHSCSRVWTSSRTRSRLRSDRRSIDARPRHRQAREASLTVMSRCRVAMRSWTSRTAPRRSPRMASRWPRTSSSRTATTTWGPSSCGRSPTRPTMSPETVRHPNTQPTAVPGHATRAAREAQRRRVGGLGRRWFVRAIVRAPLEGAAPPSPSPCAFLTDRVPRAPGTVRWIRLARPAWLPWTFAPGSCRARR